jgi:hypothetical protein
MYPDGQDLLISLLARLQLHYLFQLHTMRALPQPLAVDERGPRVRDHARGQLQLW